MTDRENQPAMPGWNLGLRFVLEVAALVGIGAGVGELVDGAARWPAIVAATLIAATVWGVFNVPDDPSRSGAAPVVVAGAVRLAVELAVLVGGWVGYWLADLPALAVVFAALTVGHYAGSQNRLRWLLSD